MARFDPVKYPDRLAFEANARALRRAEHDRMMRSAARWLARQWARCAHGVVRHPIGIRSMHGPLTR